MDCLLKCRGKQDIACRDCVLGCLTPSPLKYRFLLLVVDGLFPLFSRYLNGVLWANSVSEIALIARRLHHVCIYLKAVSCLWIHSVFCFTHFLPCVGLRFSCTVMMSAPRSKLWIPVSVSVKLPKYCQHSGGTLGQSRRPSMKRLPSWTRKDMSRLDQTLFSHFVLVFISVHKIGQKLS